jgi:hypothetical protein
MLTNDYVDDILFSKALGLVMTGQLTDDIPESTRPRTFSGAWDPWFYLHASQQARKPSLNNDLFPPPTDYIPLAEYLFRYNCSSF